MNRKDLHTNTSWLKLPRIAGIFATALVAAAIHTAAMAQDEQSGNSGKTENPAAQNRTAEKESSDGTIRELDPMVIADTRTATPISETTRSVTTLDREMIEEQAELDLNLSNILGQTVPGMSPSTEAVSNFGQSLRGRNFLVLVDGVPQSTPLRDGFRDLNTIDPSAIERIEVVRGGSAAYGFGAAGGLVNIITKEPSSENFSGYSSVGASFSTEHFEDSGQYRTSHRISGTKDQWSYVAALGFVERNSRFDSDGKRIPPDPLGAQGGFSDTTQWDFLGKLGYEFDAGDQRFDFMVNYFDVEQDTDYIFGSPSTLGFDPLPNSKRTPAVRTSQAVPGSANIKNPGTENFVTNLQYQNDAWLGGSARVNAYYGDQTAIFSKFPGFPQSRIESEKYGTRYTANTPLDSLLDRMELTWGLDFIHDETVQNVFGAGTTADTVALEQDALAGFAELEVPVGDIGQIRSGVRHEIIEVDVDTVDPNRFGNTVLGGDLGFDETLFNLSGVYFLSDTMELFGGFSQGFSLNDLGRSIDDAG
ncbi:MAG: TonB-dependent receptor, partial [Opitutales bacterium]